MKRMMIMYHMRLLVLSSVVKVTTASWEHQCMYINYRGRDATRLNCSSQICKRVFKITYLQVPPYSTANFLKETLKSCCGVRIQIETKELTNITEVSYKEMNATDFLMPILGRSDAQTLYGHYFIPVIDVPNMFYFTPKYRTVLENLLVGCISLYPLFIVLLLLATILGFAIWCTETRCNDIQFPRSFISGMIEGCWFCFTAMTTVGFGELTVKSNAGRFLSIITILIGIIMFGLLTSLFTTEIMKATATEYRIEGCKVGALKYRDYDAGVIVNHGGIIEETHTWNFYSDILMLFRKLRARDIDGFVIDKYTLAFTDLYLNWKRNNRNTTDHYFLNGNRSTEEAVDASYNTWKDDIDFFKHNTYKTYKPHGGGEKFSYGVLVKDKDVYHYFKHAIMDNRYSIQVSIGSEMNSLFPRVSEANLSAPHYEMAIKALCVTVGFIFLFGIGYEVYNYHYRKSSGGEKSFQRDESKDSTVRFFSKKKNSISEDDNY